METLSNVFETGVIVDVTEAGETDDLIEAVFNEVFTSPRQTKISQRSLCTELFEYETYIDENNGAFNFFKQKFNQAEFLVLKNVVQSILSILLSPAIAQRMFSRAIFLTEKRRNRLSMQNLRLQLICLGSEKE